MKKVFALLSASALLFTIVAVFATPSVEAASEKWTVDPTLAEDEIAMYEMNSIYTTFPNYYDNAKVADPFFAGTARMYPWNETRLRVAQFDENGTATGKYYAVYFSGLTQPLDGNGDPQSGAGCNILYYNVDGDGKVITQKSSLGKMASAGNAADPSLSHMRTNISGKDILFNASETFSGDEGSSQYNRALWFDASGNAIRGITGDPFFAKEGSDGAPTVVYAPEYCYSNKKVVKAGDDVVCDKVMKEKVDADGNPVLDGEGNVIMEETDQDNYIYQRFEWAWYTNEQWENADVNPGVNEVGYLAEGWVADKWDYAWEQDGGHMAIAFVSSEGGAAKLTDAQKAVDTTDADGFRKCVKEIFIPAGGWSYDFGYLDKGVAEHYANFNQMWTSSYKFGRVAADAEIPYAKQKTYNFSSSGIKAKDVIRNDVSYQLKEGTNIIEVLQGSVFKPGDNVSYTGLTRYWGTQDDVQSYTADASKCEFKLAVNGTNVVTKAKYESWDAMCDDFNKDYNYFAHEVKKLVLDTTFDCREGKLVNLSWEFISPNATGNNFYDYYEGKWDWLSEYIHGYCVSLANDPQFSVYAGTSWAGNFASTKTTASPYNYFLLFNAFFTGGRCFVNDANKGWVVPAAQNETDFNGYTIDTTTAAIDEQYNVAYTVIGASASDTRIIKYVVVDSYTPILKINEDKLHIDPRIVDEKAVVDPIDPYSLVTAYNAKYSQSAAGNGIYGMDITTEVVFSGVDASFWAKPKEGEHSITATITRNGKIVQKTFTLYIADITAPNVYTRSVTLAYGSDFTADMGIVFAYDAVDGDLTQSGVQWYSDRSNPKVDTTKPAKYTVSVEVSDRSANTKTVSYTVTVLPKVLTDTTDLQNQLEDAADVIDSLKTQLDAMTKKLEELQTKLATVDTNTTPGCKSKSAYVFQIVGAAALALILLKKKEN